MRLILIALALVAVFTTGIYIGMVNAPVSTTTLEPYQGPGSGVLRHGTILKEEYKGPESISGTLDIKGIWILKEQ